MTRYTARSILLVTAFALTLAALAASGCSSASQPAAPASTAPQTAAPTPQRDYRLATEGLIVTIEATAVLPSHGTRWLQDSRQPVPQPSTGHRVMWIRAAVVNSTDATAAMMTNNNLPVVTDSRGRRPATLLPIGYAYYPDGIPPHKSAVIVVPYDVAPESQAYTVTWAGLGDTVALIRFPWQ